MLLWGVGRDGVHVHEFIFDRDHHGATEPGGEFLDDLTPKEDVTLTELVGTRTTLDSLCDFGDSWRQKIKAEKIAKLESSIGYAQRVDGENACPPRTWAGLWATRNSSKRWPIHSIPSAPRRRSRSVDSSILALWTSTRSIPD